jgi:hypothetical protein
MKGADPLLPQQCPAGFAGDERPLVLLLAPARVRSPVRGPHVPPRLAASVLSGVQDEPALYVESAAGAGGGNSALELSKLPAPDRLAPQRSSAALRATVISHAPGRSGMPCSLDGVIWRRAGRRGRRSVVVAAPRDSRPLHEGVSVLAASEERKGSLSALSEAVAAATLAVYRMERALALLKRGRESRPVRPARRPAGAAR